MKAKLISRALTFIGRRPIAVFGNSDGDQQMLEWTMGCSGARFVFIVHLDFNARWIHDFEVRNAVEGAGFNFTAT